MSKAPAEAPAKPANFLRTVIEQDLASGTLESITERVLSEGLNPEPRSGRQERLENYVNRFV